MGFVHIDHVGLVAYTIEQARQVLGDTLGLELDEPRSSWPDGSYFPPEQTYNFFFSVGSGETQVEVLIPEAGATSGTARFLERRGPGLHHLCYACADVHAEAERLVANGLGEIALPRTADGRRTVAFFHPRSTGGVLTELVPVRARPRAPGIGRVSGEPIVVMAPTTGTATVVFTDLVDSTRLRATLGEAGADELRRHHDAALGEAVAAHRGRIVKGSGDGIVASFEAASDGLAAAVAMQQAIEVLGRRRRLELAVRVGLSAGDVSWEDGDCFGLPVVEAARLEAAARPGQILCSDLVRAMARGRSGAALSPLGELELKGLAEPLAAWDVGWEPLARPPATLLTTLVGRDAEVAALARAWQAATATDGGLALVEGDAGMGKSRLLAELVASVEREGGATWLGSCVEGDPRAYGPFADALDRYIRATAPEELAGVLGPQASLLVRLAPAIADALPGLEAPPPVPPEEERNRLHDAVAVVATRLADKRPLLVVVDDGHWADADSVALLRLLARRAIRARMLVIVAHRGVDLPADHPLALALPFLRREPTTTFVSLDGLDTRAVEELVESLAAQPVAPELSAALAQETGGNPFFVRELVLHLAESGRLIDDTARRDDLPRAVRDVIGRRIASLSEPAQKLLAVGSTFEAGFVLRVVADVAGVDEDRALDALDECLAAHVVEATERFDVYDFTHALFRHVLWTGQNPSRQVRLHRAIAERLEQELVGEPTAAESAAIAHRYHRSAQLPGAERGVPFALAVADQAAARHMAAEEHTALAVALDLLPPDDEQIPLLQARAARAALLAGLHMDVVLSHADIAVRAVAQRDGPEAACRSAVDLGRLAERIDMTVAWPIGRLAESMRNDLQPGSESWVQLQNWELNEAESRDPANLGVPLDSAERRHLNTLVLTLPPWQRPAYWTIYASRRELLDDYRAHGRPPPASMLAFLTGDYRLAVSALRSSVDRALRRGLISTALWHLGLLGRVQAVLGQLDDVAATQAEGDALLERVEISSNAYLQFVGIEFYRSVLVDDDPHRALRAVEPTMTYLSRPELHWVSAGVRFMVGWGDARAGATRAALIGHQEGVEAIDRAPAGAPNLTAIACGTADILWRLERTDRIDVVERNLRTKVIEPDFCFAEFDGRWAMGQVCALTGLVAEARGWFQRGIDRVTDQGAVLLVPHIAIDAALAEARAGLAGDRAVARRRLDEARREIDRIGLPRLLPRLEAVAGQLDG